MLISGKSHSRALIGQTRDSIKTWPSTYPLQCAPIVVASIAAADSSCWQTHWFVVTPPNTGVPAEVGKTLTGERKIGRRAQKRQANRGDRGSLEAQARTLSDSLYLRRHSTTCRLDCGPCSTLTPTMCAVHCFQ